jgi:hypothetical protein
MAISQKEPRIITFRVVSVERLDQLYSRNIKKIPPDQGQFPPCILPVRFHNPDLTEEIDYVKKGSFLINGSRLLMQSVP